MEFNLPFCCKVKKYAEFISTQEKTYSRFCIIINLTHSTVEIISKVSFRFIGNDCGNKCVGKNIKVLSQLQNTRYWNTFHRYNYKIIFNISPFGPFFASNSNLYDTEENRKKHGDIPTTPPTDTKHRQYFEALYT